MKQFALCYRSSTRHGDKAFAVHASGCSDLNRERTRYAANVDNIDAATVKNAVNVILDEDMRERGWADSDVQVYPCCRTGVKVAKPLDQSVCPGTGQPINNPQRRLYMPCPVCTRFVGTGRGTVPRHKRKK